MSGHARNMAHALRLARRGWGNVWPNPAVGCVIIREGCVVGRGWTQPGGRPHAEVVALAQAGTRAQGATAYVTLEPCAHYGRTPSCADALIKAGIVHVVVALTDPDPRVSGRGLSILREANIKITQGVCSQTAWHDQAGFLSRIKRARPMLTLKLANSFDGGIATANGDSHWITSPIARRHVHMLRMQYDAILVGGQTARADLPGLNIRGMGNVAQPVRIVATSANLQDLPRGDDFGALWHVTETGTGRSDKRLIVNRNGDGLDLSQMMRSLGEQGLTRILCEGGGRLAASLLKHDLVDELIGYTAGLVIGGDARPSIGALDLPSLSAAPRFDLVETRALGPDIFHHWRRIPD